MDDMNNKPLSEKYPNASKKAAEKKDISEKIKLNNDDEQKRSKITSVVMTPAKKKKRGFLAKATDELVEEAVPSVWNYILHEVLIPAVKDLIYDSVSGGMDKLLFHNDPSPSRSKRNKSNGGVIYTPYNSIYDRKNRERYSQEPRRHKTRFRSEDYALQTRNDAAMVLEEMANRIGTYGSVSVADFLDLMEVSSEYTDQNYGWTDLDGSGISRTRDGYVVKLPSPMSII